MGLLRSLRSLTMTRAVGFLGNTPCTHDAPMRMKACETRQATHACVIASDHRERGNLTVFPGGYAPQLL
ncbi:hypothetical protein [Candidatus Methylomirabilis sp.]|uniref:hypothetical protein n=1 Tax=Candidatus Methylomirabilis sp. TaxID=2032687 RepID=UPI003C75B065